MRSTFSKVTASLVIALATCMWLGMAVAEEAGHAEKGEHQEGAEEGAVHIPDTPDGIVSELLTRDLKIQHLIEAGELTKIHVPAFEGKDLAEALAKNPGAIAEEGKKALDAAVKRIGAAAKLLDKYGDAEDADKTKTAYKPFSEGIQAIRVLYPKVTPSDYWTCTMHPDVWKAEAGKCPKCGMDLVEKKSKAAHTEHAEHK